MCEPNWKRIFEEYADVYFLRHEVNRLENANLALEWQTTFSYSLGYDDAKSGKDFDDEFKIDKW